MDKQSQTNMKLKKPKLPPVIRQTKTSAKRMYLANPLLLMDEAGKKLDLERPSLVSKTLPCTIAKKPAIQQNTGNSNKPVLFKKPSDTCTSQASKPKKPVYEVSKSKCTRPPVEIKSKVCSFRKKPLVKSKSEQSPEKAKCLLPPKKISLSASDLYRKKNIHFNLDRSQSQEFLGEFADVSPIVDVTQKKQFLFKSPSAYNRRSIVQYTPQSNRSSYFKASTPARLDLERLQERLNQWLKSRGKPPAVFHHLRMFGAHVSKADTTFSGEDKENEEVSTPKSESYENLHISNESENKEKPLTLEEIAKYAKEALPELLRLIEEDYPSSQCSTWLDLIREKVQNIDNEPEYWECKAALEKRVGNISNAIDYYKNAIIHGAHVGSVDKSLDQLLQKFNLLNISSSMPDHKEREKKIVTDARNAFISSIIQFAVLERNLKKKGVEPLSKKVAIPVRRSTRLSRSGYINTSNITLCSTLREIDFSGDIKFEKNKALI